MKYLIYLLILLLLSTVNLFSQSPYATEKEMTWHDSPMFKFRSQKDETVWWIQTGLMAVSGIARATEQTLQHKYPNFKSRFPNANDQYWNPNLSYKNKYAGRDPNNGRAFFGSTTFLVFTTDGKHALDIVNHVPLYAGFVLPLCLNELKGLPLKNIIARYVSLVGINSLAFHFTYDKFY